MSNNSSPGSYFNENDMSGRPRSDGSTFMVIVDTAKRGPVMQRTLTLSDTDLHARFGKPNAEVSFGLHCATSYFGEGTRLYYTRVAPGATWGGTVVKFDGRFNSLHSWDEGTERPEEYNFLENDLFIVYAENPGDWNRELSIALLPDTRNLTSNKFTLQLFKQGSTLAAESYDVCLDHRVDGFGVQLQIEDHINSRSNNIRVLVNKDHPLLKQTPAFRFINTLNIGDSADFPGVQMLGGTDGRAPTTGDILQGWDLYEDPDEVKIDVLIAAGNTDLDVIYRMDEICRTRMDCVAILDVPRDKQRWDRAIAWRRNELHLDTTYSAVYAPSIEVYDNDADRLIEIPVSGAVAACYARTDRDYKRWFAPAGMIRGSLEARGVAYTYDQDMRDALFESQINAIRVFQGEGIKVWGADTLQVQPSALSNMSVRRLMIYLETTLTAANNYSVFDPNSSILWAKLTEAAETFLGRLVGEEGLYDFKVVCDETNNTPTTIANGDVMLDIYVDPVIPAKRIFLTAVVNKTGSRVTATM